MSQNFYFYKANKYVVEDGTIYKVINREKTKLDSNEKEELEEFISNGKNYIFKCPKLNEIAKINTELTRIDCVPMILEALEDYIPMDLKDSFYENLKTIHFKIDGYIDIDEKKSYSLTYDSRKNIIILRGKYLGFMKKWCEENNLPIEEYHLVILHALTHELLHMASRRVDEKKNIIYTGITADPSRDIMNNNVPLNEGITEVIADSLYFSEINSRTSSYFVHSSLAYQLGMLIGGLVIEDAYFLNKGTTPIEKKLDEIEYVPERAKCMLYTFANSDRPKYRQLNYYNSLIVQDILLDYYKVRLKQALEKKDFDKIGALITTLNSFFIKENCFGDSLSEKCMNQLNSNRNKFNELLKLYGEFIITEDYKEKIKE